LASNLKKFSGEGACYQVTYVQYVDLGHTTFKATAVGKGIEKVLHDVWQ